MYTISFAMACCLLRGWGTYFFTKRERGYLKARMKMGAMKVKLSLNLSQIWIHERKAIHSTVMPSAHFVRQSNVNVFANICEPMCSYF